MIATVMLEELLSFIFDSSLLIGLASPVAGIQESKGKKQPEENEQEVKHHVSAVYQSPREKV
jgi:hypothetical protein